MNKTKCNGCTFSRHGILSLCTFRYNHKIKECPCTDCLVKTMCTRDCAKRNDAFYKIYEERRHCVMSKCIGCDSYGYSCVHEEYNSMCPCVECLIKTMCSNSCDDYHSFIGKIPKEKLGVKNDKIDER